MPTSAALLAPEQATETALDALHPEVESAAGYARAARAEATTRAYAGDLDAFRAWCAARGLAALPATPGVVAVYLAALADQGRKPATIARALAGIAAAHRAAGLPWAKSAPAIVEVMKGIRRALGVAPEQKAPVTDAELRALVAALEGPAAVRDRALLLVGWFGAFRRSEIVALEVSDVEHVTEGLRVRVRRSKTDQEGTGDTKGIPFASDPALCPVRALVAWLEAAGITEGPIFRAVDKGGNVGPVAITGAAVALVVKRAASRAGLDAGRFAGHSLRSGFATTAAAKGRGLDAIMRQTGHRSERVARRYIRHATVFVQNAAVGLL